MKTSDFSYNLPERLIAQVPLENRESSKLMIMDRKSGEIKHTSFHFILDELNENDVLVINNSKVIPARLFGIKQETGAHVELLILKIEGNQARCIVGNAKVVKQNTKITLGDGQIIAKCIQVLDEGIRIFELEYEGILMERLSEIGEMPLPPYIHKKLKDQSRYQTVYAQIDGSAAAPTAGLHFTPELLTQIESKGVTIVKVTLHVGLGTFRPVKVENVLEHHMHHESYFVSKAAADILNNAKKTGKRIIAVGTTSTRVLETQMEKFGEFKEESCESNIFIYPGFEFKAIDGLITNFHLPESTLLMLVSAFSDKALILNAYNEAVEREYRFFSFGDAMFIR